MLMSARHTVSSLTVTLWLTVLHGTAGLDIFPFEGPILAIRCLWAMPHATHMPRDVPNSGYPSGSMISNLQGEKVLQDGNGVSDITGEAVAGVEHVQASAGS